MLFTTGSDRYYSLILYSIIKRLYQNAIAYILLLKIKYIKILFIIAQL